MRRLFSSLRSLRLCVSPSLTSNRISMESPRQIHQRWQVLPGNDLGGFALVIFSAAVNQPGPGLAGLCQGKPILQPGTSRLTMPQLNPFRQIVNLIYN